MRATRFAFLLAPVLANVDRVGGSAGAGRYSGTPPAHRLQLLARGLEGTLGSAVAPDGALYLVDGVKGEVLRVDPWSGNTSTFARG